MHHSEAKASGRGSCSPRPACPACRPRHASGRCAQTGAGDRWRRWDRRRVRTGARAAGAPALRPARVVAPSAPGGPTNWTASGSPSGRRPGRQHERRQAGQVPGRRPRRPPGVGRDVGQERPLVPRPGGQRRPGGHRGEQHVDVVEEADHPLPEPLAPCAGRTSPARRDQPADPGVRAAARLQRRAVEAVGARRRRRRRPSSGPAPPSGGAGGDRRVPPHDGVPGRRRAAATTASTAARAGRVGADARAPATGWRPRSAAAGPAPASGAGSSPARTACATARSATVVARAPFSAMPDQLSAPISAGTTPRPGLSVTSPQAAAGRRSEPMPSLPWASGTQPAATAAALPPELPRRGAGGVPGVAAHRARAVGGAVEAELGHAGDADDDRAGLAQPGDHGVVARSPGRRLLAGDPSVQTSPATATLSLTAIGTPGERAGRTG